MKRSHWTTILVVLLILSLSFSIIAGCSNGNKYSGFGFAFEYPQGYTIAVNGLFDPQANMESGIVEVRCDKEPKKSFQVIWQQRSKENYESTVQLEKDLAGLFDALTSTRRVDLETGQQAETTLRGHPTIYQTYSAFPQEVQFEAQYGVQAVLYCQSSEKWFALKTFRDAPATDTALVEDFLSFADTFRCH